MCYSFQNHDMISWLKMQVRVLEAWREDIASQSDLDFDMITRLERHYQWLTAEVCHLEDHQPRPHRGPAFNGLKAI
ncbi:MAG: hypothetical protein AAFR51_12345 [Pseudomonadota bacterium]